MVSRSALELARFERDEWHRRAEEARGSDRPPVSPRRSSNRRWWLLVLAVAALVAVASVGSAFGGDRAGEASADYSGCISRARYEHPIEGNQYQELVNALYACGVYKLP